ncbi:RNA polymerase recycling motor HelD [Clostridium lundense]|uniref:RNA polymerase recycling motor HelD n=1 Tax=Clostridium lundense TaxID=319475 RepID=UPI0004818295|nr:RNA polymerase recycling motor HelD [Clostridium lundense]
MSIDSKEFNFEECKLQDTIIWLKDEIKYLQENNKSMKKTVQKLKKEAKGRYSVQLEAAIKVHEMLKEKLKGYKDVKESPYFARIDFTEKRRDKESFYIGKIGLTDDREEDEKVIDWRAPIADLYYSGTEGKANYEGPYGMIEGELLLKRKFIIKNKKLVNAFDEGANQIILKTLEGSEEGEALQDEFLKITLEESANKKLKDIVATIQKEQNDIIRSEKNKALIVQGSAGSGKTTIALHRLAYLLYKYKNKILPEEVLVLAPNKLFLDYISEVLPNLGSGKVSQKTFEEMSKELLQLKEKICSKDEKLSFVIENLSDKQIKYIVNSSKVKGSLVFKTIMDRYVKYIEFTGMDYEDIKIDDYIIYTGKEIKDLFIKNLKHLPLEKRKEEMKRYFNAQLGNRLENINNTIEEQYEFLLKHVRNSMEESAEKRRKLTELYDERNEKIDNIKQESKKIMKEYFNNLGKINIVKLYTKLFNDDEIYSKVTSGKVPKALWNYMRDELNTNINNKTIDSDDLAPMLYLKFKIQGIKEEEKYKHIVIDEAQDYSSFEIYLLKSMVSNNSFTVVGDVGQSIYYYKGIGDWNKLIHEVYEDEVEYIPLTQSYRSTVEIVNFANKVLKKQENSLNPAKPVLRHGKIPQIIRYSNDEEILYTLKNIIKEVESLGKSTIALIGKDFEECREVYHLLNSNYIKGWSLVGEDDSSFKCDKLVIPSYMTKGLEFDCSIVLNCSKDKYANTSLDKKLLYVVLTRALHLEYILYKGEVSELI